MDSLGDILKSAHEFSIEVLNAAKKYEFIKSLSSEIQDGIVFWCRLYIEMNFFIDVFYNSITSKTAYTLVSEEKRIFGADNTGGWHYHPFDDPIKHVPSNEFSIVEFLEKVKKLITGKNKEAKVAP